MAPSMGNMPQKRRDIILSLALLYGGRGHFIRQFTQTCCSPASAIKRCPQQEHTGGRNARSNLSIISLIVIGVAVPCGVGGLELEEFAWSSVWFFLSEVYTCVYIEVSESIIDGEVVFGVCV